MVALLFVARFHALLTLPVAADGLGRHEWLRICLLLVWLCLPMHHGLSGCFS